jgi:hypothetical protein
MTRSHSRLVRVVIGLCAAVAAIVGVTAATAPQSASAYGTPGCVSRAEYRQARRGMSQAKVARLFGTTGKVTANGDFGGYRFVNRKYRTCTSRYGGAYLSFANDGPRTPVVLDSRFVIW